MFVRWKRRERSAHKHPTDEYVLTAYLVKSERVNGKPRQRIVTYLGAIRENHRDTYWHQVDFWKAARRNILRLNLDDATRNRIVDRLAATVAIPTPQGRAATSAQLEAAEKFRKPA